MLGIWKFSGDIQKQQKIIVFIAKQFLGKYLYLLVANTFISDFKMSASKGLTAKACTAKSYAKVQQNVVENKSGLNAQDKYSIYSFQSNF